MEARAVKIGSNLAFMIPQSIAMKCGIEESSSVDISFKGDEIIIKPMRKKYHLVELLAGITPENMHAEVGGDGPVGRELL